VTLVMAISLRQGEQSDSPFPDASCLPRAECELCLCSLDIAMNAALKSNDG
jgi:hypothetical protein